MIESKQRIEEKNDSSSDDYYDYYFDNYREAYQSLIVDSEKECPQGVITAFSYKAK